MAEKQAGVFNKKADTSMKNIPTPHSTFTAENTDLLKNIRSEEDILKTNNKSLGIPASIWCSYMALLDTTDNDYTYELLEELVQEKIKQLNPSQHQDYLRRLDRKEEQERERLQKKLKKK